MLEIRKKCSDLLALGCNNGTAIIEFAVIAPLLFLLLIGFIEVGMIFFTQSVLEAATNIGSRAGKTGYTEAGIDREQYIRARIQKLSGGFLDDGLLEIKILSYNDFKSIGQPEPCDPPSPPPCKRGFKDINGNGEWDTDQGAETVGTDGKIVVYKVTYPWQVFTPLLSEVLTRDGSTVRNEEFTPIGAP